MPYFMTVRKTVANNASNCWESICYARTEVHPQPEGQAKVEVIIKIIKFYRAWVFCKHFPVFHSFFEAANV